MYLQDQIRELDRTKKWEPTFQMIQLETISIAESKTQKVAKLAENRSLNRYRDVLPYDDSRVILKSSTNDYINANFVQAPDVNRTYILTQGPLPHTCESFWQMVWENNTEGIVMLNKIVEKNAIKCHPYWPMGEEESMQFGDYEVCNLSESSESSYIVRELLLTHLASSAKRTIKQFHFMTWPDFGVPDDPLTFLNFLAHVKSTGVLFSNPVIHCSAGIGRSGTFCLVDAALAMAKQSNTPEGLDPRALLLTLRKYRSGLIQTAEQYRFALVTILYGLKQLFPQYFLKNENEKVEEGVNDNPPPLPPRRQNNKPPEKPQRTSVIYEENKPFPKEAKSTTVIESSSDGDSEEEILDLTNMSDKEEEEEFTEYNYKNGIEESGHQETNETIAKLNNINKAGSENDNLNENSFVVNQHHTKPDIDNKKSNETNTLMHKARKSEQENENIILRQRQRQEKNIETKNLIEKIKKNMKKSEKEPNRKFWLCVGAIAVFSSAAIIAYSWLR